jgi:hypothetical protein
MLHIVHKSHPFYTLTEQRCRVCRSRGSYSALPILSPERDYHEAFRDFLQSFQANLGTIPQIRSVPLLSEAFQIHYTAVQ